MALPKGAGHQATGVTGQWVSDTGVFTSTAPYANYTGSHSNAWGALSSVETKFHRAGKLDKLRFYAWSRNHVAPEVVNYTLYKNGSATDVTFAYEPTTATNTFYEFTGTYPVYFNANDRLGVRAHWPTAAPSGTFRTIAWMVFAEVTWL